MSFLRPERDLGEMSFREAIFFAQFPRLDFHLRAFTI